MKIQTSRQFLARLAARRLSRAGLSLVVATAALALPIAAQGAAATWTGTTSGVWDTASNWTAGGPPASADGYFINSTANNAISLTAAQAVFSLHLSGASLANYTFGGAQLQSGGSGSGVTVESTATNGATITFNNNYQTTTTNRGNPGGFSISTASGSNANLIFNGNIFASLATPASIITTVDFKLSNAANAGSTVVNGIIKNAGLAETGTLGVTKTGGGAGILTLNGANTYSGQTDWNTDTGGFILGNKSAFGMGALRVNGTSASGTISANTALTGANAIANTINFNANTNVTTTSNAVITFAAGSPTGTLVSGTSPAVGDMVTVGAQYMPIYAKVTAVSGSTITFDTNAATAGNGTLTTKNFTASSTGIFSVAGTNAIEFSGTQNLSTVYSNGGIATRTFAITNTADTTFSGALQELNGAASIAKTGTGKLIITGNNTFSGGTSLGGGTLLVGNNNALGTGNVTVATATTFGTSVSGISLASANNVILTATLTLGGSNPFTINGGFTTSGSNRTFDNAITGTTTIAGTINLSENDTQGRTLTIGSTATASPGTTLLSGVIQNNSGAATMASNFVAGGGGTIILTGGNTYTGTTTVQNTGTVLRVGNGGTTGNLGTGAVTVTTANLAFNRSNALTVTNAIGGTGSVSQTGVGTTLLTGANTYSGVTTISAGTLSIGDGGSIGALNSSSNIVDNSALVFNRTGFFSQANVISGSGTVLLTSLLGTATGSLTLNGATSSYTGTTTIQNGDLNVGTNSILASTNGPLGNATSAIVLGNAGTQASSSGGGFGPNAALVVTSAGAAANYSITRDIDSSATANVSGRSDIRFNGPSLSTGTLTISSNWALGTGASRAYGLVSSQAGQTLDFTGAITGSGSTGTMRINDYGGGNGIVRLSNSGNTYADATSVTNGLLLIAGNAGASSGVLGTNVTLNISEGGNGFTAPVGGALTDGAYTVGKTIALNDNATATSSYTLGGNQAVSSLFTGNVNTNATVNSRTLNLSQVAGGTVTFSGNIGANTNNTGATSVATTGAGTVILSGNNTYDGTTTVSAGTLQLGSSTALGKAGRGTGVLDPSSPGGAGGTTLSTFGGTTVASTATLSLGGTAVGAEPITLNGTGVSALGGLVNNSATPATINSALGLPEISLTASGSGYSTSPTVTISGGGGTGATAAAYLNVQTISVTNGGSGYTTAPSVSFTTAGGAGASATATISGGVVTSITITNHGGGYTSRPTISFSGGSGSGATATVTDQLVTALDLTNVGSGYTSTPTITLTGGSGTGATVAASINTINLAADSSIGGSGNTTIAGVIGGAGGLTQVGTGTLFLTGANTYTGTTLISAGTLSVGNGFNTGTLPAGGAITNNATLAFNRTGTITQGTDFGPSITGTGGVTQAGTGTTFLTGTNTYTGTTLISAGTLSVGNGFNTGTLPAGGTITNNATLAFNRTDTITQGTDFGPSISGTGAVTQAGMGTTILTGTNTYAGTTTISAGTLQLGNAGTTGSLSPSGTITNNAMLAFNRTDTITQGTDFGPSISGTGGVTQVGTGTTIFTGTNTYTGTTLISAGTLNVGNGFNTGTLPAGGAITNNATLAFNRNDTITQGTDFGPSISGTGAVTQAGMGTVVFTGTNTYTGATTVNSGTLLVNGSTSASSAVAVNNTATLGGLGTVNGVTTVGIGATLLGGDGMTASGALTLTATPILNSGSILSVVLGAGDPTSHSTLALPSGFNGFNSDQTFNLVNLQVGTYDNIITGVANDITTSGWTIANGPGASFSFTDDNMGGIDLTITAVPEPATWLGGGLLVAGAIWSQRKRVRSLVRTA